MSFLDAFNFNKWCVPSQIYFISMIVLGTFSIIYRFYFNRHMRLDPVELMSWFASMIVFSSINVILLNQVCKMNTVISWILIIVFIICTTLLVFEVVQLLKWLNIWIISPRLSTSTSTSVANRSRRQ